MQCELACCIRNLDAFRFYLQLVFDIEILVCTNKFAAYSNSTWTPHATT